MRWIHGMVVAASMWPGALAAKSGFVGRLPSNAGCETCHFSQGGGGARYRFGNDFRDAGLRWTSALAALDSDGDGYTNGVELGDPEGTWRANQARPVFVSNPGVPELTPCGNGRIDPKVEGVEACDGEELGGITCASLSLPEGVLTCSTECELDTTTCRVPRCGDGFIDDGEACDGDDLGGQTCASLGAGEGALACNVSCAYDRSGCVVPPLEDMGRDMTPEEDLQEMDAGVDMMDAPPEPDPEPPPEVVDMTQDSGGEEVSSQGCAQAGGSTPSTPATLLWLCLGWVARRQRKR